MNDKARTEETIIVTKGSADSLHVHIPYKTVYIQRIRQISGRRWEPKQKLWIIPHNITSIQEFTNHFDVKDTVGKPLKHTAVRSNDFWAVILKQIQKLTHKRPGVLFGFA
ncbi:MAG: hypothetical protein ACE3K2_28950 [Paenibacillus sp.]|uniref:hypothetical protein n=1 Tax=Paenibacillus sp. TaxID=58172 RepID=UPI003B80D6B6